MSRHTDVIYTVHSVWCDIYFNVCVFLVVIIIASLSTIVFVENILVHCIVKNCNLIWFPFILFIQPEFYFDFPGRRYGDDGK